MKKNHFYFSSLIQSQASVPLYTPYVCPLIVCDTVMSVKA